MKSPGVQIQIPYERIKRRTDKYKKPTLPREYRAVAALSRTGLKIYEVGLLFKG